MAEPVTADKRFSKSSTTTNVKDAFGVGVQDCSQGRRCHIVIGGGSSGILLCTQLLEFDDVILIERGSRNPHSVHATSRNPSLWPVAAFAEGEAFRNNTLPQSPLSNRVIMYPQGSGVGGTSNLNAMILSAGHPTVFDNHWHQKWSSEVMSRFVCLLISIARLSLNLSFHMNVKYYRETCATQI